VILSSDRINSQKFTTGEINRINIAADVNSEKHNATAMLRVALKTVVHKMFS